MGPCHPSTMRDFHVRRTARERYAIDDTLIGIRGDLVVTDVFAIRRLAARMNADRPPGAPSVGAGEIGALGLLHEVGHLLIARYLEIQARTTMATVLQDVRGRVGDDADRVLDRYAAAFPGLGPEPEPLVERLEELLLTRVANENPALGPLRELVDDRILNEGTRYEDVIAGLEAAFAQGEHLDVAGLGPTSLIELMRSPARHAPTSLVGPAALHPRALGRDPRRAPGRADRPTRHGHRAAARGGARAASAVRWR